MNKRLPNLEWIRVFDAAARNQSFVMASEELHVTPGAVSHRVKSLETYLGVELFRRRPSGVELTDVGREFADSLQPLLAKMATAVHRVQNLGPSQRVRVTALPALAEKWLVPKLGQFNELYPQISIELEADATIRDLTDGKFDIGLRYTDNDFSGLTAYELFREDIFPVVSPTLAASRQVDELQDIFKFTLLQDSYWQSDWVIWCDAAGISLPETAHSTVFTLYSMAVNAAVAGQGVLMGHEALVAEELKDGRLVSLFDVRARLPKQHYAVVLPSALDLPTVRSFLDWITSLQRN